MNRALGILVEYAPAIFNGFLTTIVLAFAVIATATPIALLLAVLRNTAFGWVAACYVNVIRVLPALVILYMSFYALPRWGIRLSPYEAAYYGLTAVATAYLSEDIRGGLKSIDPGQYMAAKALGIPPWRTLFRVTIPQALPVIAPNYMTGLMLTIQGTSLASFVAVTELSGATSRAISLSQDAYMFLAISAALYLALNGVCALAQAWLSRRLSIETKIRRQQAATLPVL